MAFSIIRGVFCLIALASCVSTVVAAKSDTRFKHRPVVLLVGDSVTELAADPSRGGWATLLQHQYIRSADIVNRGLSGYNTRWFRQHAIPVIIDEIESSVYTPALITVWFGVNDAVLVNGSDAVKYVPIHNYTDNLVSIVCSLKKAAPKAKILLITPPHVDDAARRKFAAKRTDGKRGLIDRSNEMAGKYAHSCLEVGSRVGIPVLDVYTYFNSLSEAERSNTLVDGLHYNAAGSKIVSEQIQKAVKNQFPGVASRLESWQLPPPNKWIAEDHSIDPNKPGKDE